MKEKGYGWTQYIRKKTNKASIRRRSVRLGYARRDETRAAQPSAEGEMRSASEKALIDQSASSHSGVIINTRGRKIKDRVRSRAREKLDKREQVRRKGELKRSGQRSQAVLTLVYKSKAKQNKAEQSKEKPISLGLSTPGEKKNNVKGYPHGR